MDALQQYVPEISILLGALLVVILVFATMERRRRRSVAAGNQATARPRLERLDRFQLSGADRLTLDRLSWLLRSPGRIDRILSNRSLFLKAARRALDEGLLDEEELLALGRRSGFKLDRIRSREMDTKRLPSGVEVSVADDSRNSAAGILFQNHPDALKVRLNRGRTSFAAGTRLDVVCNSSRGLYRFFTTVTRTSGRVHLLSHTSSVDWVQRRQHRRHDLTIPVEISLGAAQAGLRTRTIDLSIGGAAIRNPGRRLVSNIDLALRFRCDGSAILVPATVVRLSHRRRSAHLRFHEVDEQTRHGLFQLMTARGRRR